MILLCHSIYDTRKPRYLILLCHSNQKNLAVLHIQYLYKGSSLHFNSYFNIAFYSLSLKESIFFNCLKTAKVVPIFKSGNAKLSNNYYRPISLISSFSKILEKLILKRLMNFFDKHKVIHLHQYGFRNKHSTEHAILDILPLAIMHWRVKPLQVF